MRPDGVIWSRSTITVVWIELTSPWEDNMMLRHSQKHACYTQLKIDCEAFEWICKVPGLNKEELKCKVEKTALHCSHTNVAA